MCQKHHINPQRGNNNLEQKYQIHSLETFQDERSPSNTVATARGGLDGEARSQGSLLCSSNRPHPLKISCIPVSRHTYQFNCTVLPHISPKSSHEDNEARHGLAKAVGLSNDQLYQQ